MPKQTSESGLALLITLIVVGVILSVGLAILDLTVKQVQLANNAKESEIAFQAANAGMECALYWRRASSGDMELGDPITPTCFNESTYSNSRTDLSSDPDVDGEGYVYLYEYSFDWGSGTGERCTTITTLIAKANLFDNTSSNNIINSSHPSYPFTVSNAMNILPGYPEATITCEPGGICTTLSVQGYNKNCNSLNGYGVIEREVLLEL